MLETTYLQMEKFKQDDTAKGENQHKADPMTYMVDINKKIDLYVIRKLTAYSSKKFIKLLSRVE